MSQLRSHGFTLIEIMVAVAVFGVMSVIAWGALGNSLSNVDLLTERMNRLQAIQRTMRFLSSDLTQATPRSVRDDLGDSRLPAMLSSASGNFAIEFTHGGWRNPAGLPRSTLQRTAYRLEDDELIRYHWRVLDRTYANEAVATVLLDNVESLLFRFYTDTGETTDVWPPQGGPANLRMRPRAVEILLTLPDEGEVTRLLEIAP
jgi:general secretion pathway protein J